MAQIDADLFRETLLRLAPESADQPMALAVSGGPDSLAMLLLAADAGFRATALTVDHGLRSEAAGEAAYVGEVAAARGLAHVILPVTVERSGRGLQAAARDARYAAMGQWCASAGVRLLLTAHHADDQAETLLMRMARGSGIAGMAGIRSHRPMNDWPVTLLRPLLGVRKLDLVALVEASGLRIIDDPSNDEPAFDRTLARRLLLGGGLDSARIAETAAHLAEAETALAWTAEEAWAGHAEHSESAVSIDMRGLPPELVRRLILRAIAALNGAPVPTGPEVDALTARLRRGERGNLAGIVAEPGRRWVFAPEPTRAASKRHKAHK